MMLLAFACCLTLSSAVAVDVGLLLHPELHPIHSLYHSQNFNGYYNYGYATPIITRNEVRSLDGITRGDYSYMDSNGQQQTVKYTSDPLHGFQVSASNLPQDLPEVAEAKARHLALFTTPATATGRIAHLQPVQDLPEVVAARQAHMAVLDAARAGIMQQIVQDTPEVVAARRAHMAAMEAAMAGNMQVIQDTPEVAKAKAEHMAILERIRARDEALRASYVKTNQVVPHYTPAVLGSSGLFSYGYVNGARGGYSYIDGKGEVQTIRYDDGTVNPREVNVLNTANDQKVLNDDDAIEVVNNELGGRNDDAGAKIESSRGGFLINAGNFENQDQNQMLYHQEVQY